MAKAHYIGVGGIARKVSGEYVGVSGIARKVKSGYIGVSGVARQFFPGITTWSRYTIVNASTITRNILHTYTYVGTYSLNASGSWYLATAGSGVNLVVTDDGKVKSINSSGTGGFNFRTVNEHIDTLINDNEDSVNVGYARYFYLGPQSGFSYISHTDSDSGYWEYVMDPQYVYYSGSSLYGASICFRDPSNPKNGLSSGYTHHTFSRFRLGTTDAATDSLYKLLVNVKFDRGDYVDQVTSENPNAYPTNGKHTDGYWYVKQ